VVRTAEGTVRAVGRFGEISVISYRDETLGDLPCGPQSRSLPVLVTWEAAERSIPPRDRGRVCAGWLRPLGREQGMILCDLSCALFFLVALISRHLPRPTRLPLMAGARKPSITRWPATFSARG
jgi:hypothetical protein